MIEIRESAFFFFHPPERLVTPVLVPEVLEERPGEEVPGWVRQHHPAPGLQPGVQAVRDLLRAGAEAGAAALQQHGRFQEGTGFCTEPVFLNTKSIT